MGTPTDVYALGAILYELLTGRPPFRGDTAMATLQLVQTREPDRPRSIDPAIPRDLETICLKCLEKDPRKRPGSADAVASDLLAFLEGRPIMARPVGSGERVWTWAKRHPGRAAGIVAGGTLVGRDVGRLGPDSGPAGSGPSGRTPSSGLGRNAEAVAALLDRFEEARCGRATWRSARVAQEAAERRRGEGGAEGLADRLERLRVDLAALEELNAGRSVRVYTDPEPAPGLWGAGEAVPGGAQAVWRRSGCRPDGRGGGAGDRLDGPQDQLIPVLDLVLGLDLLLRAESSTRVRAALRRLDPDPFRDAARDAALAGDLVWVGSRNWPGDQEVATQPSGFIALLGMSPGVTLSQKRGLLTEAIRRRPGDLALLMLVGYSYPINQRIGADEQVRMVSGGGRESRPDNPAARNSPGDRSAGDRGDSGRARWRSTRRFYRIDLELCRCRRANLGAPTRSYNELTNSASWTRGLARRSGKSAVRLDPNGPLPSKETGRDLLETGEPGCGSGGVPGGRSHRTGLFLLSGLQSGRGVRAAGEPRTRGHGGVPGGRSASTRTTPSAGRTLAAVYETQGKFGRGGAIERTRKRVRIDRTTLLSAPNPRGSIYHGSRGSAGRIRWQSTRRPPGLNRTTPESGTT